MGYIALALLIETSRHYGRGILRGIAKYSHLHGPLAFYSETGGRDKISYSELKDWSIDGIIARDEKLDPKMLKMGLPVVVYTSRTDPKQYKYTLQADHVGVGTMAAEHFLERKFKHFDYCGFSDIMYSKIRCKAFEERLGQEGFSVSVYERTQLEIKQSWGKEQDRLCEWLEELPKPAAIFACIDERSRHVNETCKKLGVKVPEDVAILGVDNDELVCELSDPPLSSIAMSTIQGGYDAVKLLVDLIKGKRIEQPTVTIRPTHVMVRHSTDILAIADDVVLEAIRYIRNSANAPIQIEDIVHQIAVSRRTLEVKFHQIMGRTLHAQIKYARTDKISEMLRTTNMSIQQIAQLLGYNNSNNLARYYKQGTGMTCREYRKQCGTVNPETPPAHYNTNSD